ncbi:MAG TPA: hypothetical protein VM008_22525 [Phycisphaerae bacterium]|nr:hypothetical protein [Phycisphaerae bacterium]
MSSQLHIIFMPPSIFDIVILPRGIIIMFGIMPPIIPGIIPLFIPPMPISLIRPVIIVVMAISDHLFEFKSTKQRLLPAWSL